jgi:hypothetical protein
MIKYHEQMVKVYKLKNDVSRYSAYALFLIIIILVLVSFAYESRALSIITVVFSCLTWVIYYGIYIRLAFQLNKF